MNQQTSESLRAWFKQVEGVYPELFNTAHIICGNYSQAENALRSAILEVWADNAENGMGFREKLRGAVRREALLTLREETSSDAEFTWSGLSDMSGEPLLRLAARESPETQRLLALRYGVGLSVRRAAEVTHITPSQARETLARFESRSRRALPARHRSRFDALFSRAVRKSLGSRGGIPHPSAVYRAFEAEASQMQVSNHRFSKVIYRVLVLLMALICAAMFWLFAVLVQAPELEPGIEPSPSPGVSVETRYETEGGAP